MLRATWTCSRCHQLLWEGRRQQWQRRNCMYKACHSLQTAGRKWESCTLLQENTPTARRGRGMAQFHDSDNLVRMVLCLQKHSYSLLSTTRIWVNCKRPKNTANGCWTSPERFDRWIIVAEFHLGERRSKSPITGDPQHGNFMEQKCDARFQYHCYGNVIVFWVPHLGFFSHYRYLKPFSGGLLVWGVWNVGVCVCVMWFQALPQTPQPCPIPGVFQLESPHCSVIHGHNHHAAAAPCRLLPVVRVCRVPPRLGRSTRTCPPKILWWFHSALRIHAPSPIPAALLENAFLTTVEGVSQDVCAAQTSIVTKRHTVVEQDSAWTMENAGPMRTVRTFTTRGFTQCALELLIATPGEHVHTAAKKVRCEPIRLGSKNEKCIDKFEAIPKLPQLCQN